MNIVLTGTIVLDMGTTLYLKNIKVTPLSGHDVRFRVRIASSYFQENQHFDEEE